MQHRRDARPDRLREPPLHRNEFLPVGAALLSALEEGPHAVALFDHEDSLVYANSVFRDAWSLASEGTATFESLVRSCHSRECGAVVKTDDIEAWVARAQARRREGPSHRAFQVDFWDGRWFWVSERRMANGWIFTLGQDITALKQSEHTLSLARDEALRVSLTDHLTQLPNRRSATDRLETLIGTGASFSIALIDLVHFKQINDSYGHVVGDGILVEFARRISGLLPPECQLARLAGDEFLVIGAPALPPGAFRLLCHEILARQQTPFDVLGHGVEVGASIGIATVPADATGVGELLSAADDAMYRAKEIGSNVMRCFDREMGEQRIEQAVLRRDLAAAFARRQFVPHYQPVVDLRTGALMKFEMLARWAHPRLGLLGPDRFLPIFASPNQWNVLSLQLLQQAGQDFQSEPLFPRIAFNVSPQQLKEESIVSVLNALQAERSVPLDKLEMEVTESALVLNPGEARAAVEAVRALGLTTALDDFGVGFSSLKHLREIRFDRLKLDRSFVQDVATNPRSRVFVGAMIDLARKLGLSVIVEGVEDAETARSLADLGCDYGQGYFYGRPMTAEAARQRLKEAVAVPPQP